MLDSMGGSRMKNKGGQKETHNNIVNKDKNKAFLHKIILSQKDMATWRVHKIKHFFIR
jgi:hypothetical protein